MARTRSSHADQQARHRHDASAPNTAARSQPMLSVRCPSACRRDGFINVVFIDMGNQATRRRAHDDIAGRTGLER
jgi:hypothetical protein